MSHDEVPRDTRSRHFCEVHDGTWSCDCGAGGTSENPVELVRQVRDHYLHPELP